MRLLYILPAEGFGGAERQGALHIADLPRVGVEVVAATGPGQPIQVQLARAGVRDYVLCREFPDARVSSRGWRASLARPWLYARSWRRSVRALTSLGRQRRVDAVFACRAFGWTVGSAVARRLGVPVIWRAGSHPASQAHAFALRHLARRIAPDLLIANSESGRRAYAEALGVPTTILYNAVDTERFSPGRASPRVRLDLGLGTIPVIGLAARPAPEKGLDCLAEVARRISHRFPTARFLVAGEFPLRAHYQQTFAALGQDERVSFLGHLDDIESFYASCDVVVLTSGRKSIEMSSNAILEAMAMEAAVVVTDVGGMTEAVENGASGFVVPPDDPEHFAHKLAILLDNAELRRRMGTAARRRIEDRHARHRVIADFAEILRTTCLGRWTRPDLLCTPKEAL